MRFRNTRYASQSLVFLVFLNFRFTLLRWRMAFVISGVINFDWPEAATRFLILMSVWSSSISVYIFLDVIDVFEYLRHIKRHTCKVLVKRTGIKTPAFRKDCFLFG